MPAWLHFINAISKLLTDTIDEYYLKGVFQFKQWKNKLQRIRPCIEVSKERIISKDAKYPGSRIRQY